MESQSRTKVNLLATKHEIPDLEMLFRRDIAFLKCAHYYNGIENS